ncbi:neprilysin-21 [Stomoxys calcitrans]|uniref:Peptidase M13 C-terminal domain-containing protein n=1 Tax=Stomoxys calcitrans TaxID=35570 RepID=A0A1I8QBY5_STOCA|nr:neprilysin-21 [Stomoxys calcitrans]
MLKIAYLVFTSFGILQSSSTTVSSNEDDFQHNYVNKMLSYMNQSVQPCEDFYEYACGNWKNIFKHQQTHYKVPYFPEVNYNIQNVVEAVLEKSHINDSAPEYEEEFQKAKKFYSNCMQTELYPMRKSLAYLDIIKQIGGFPAIEDKWNASQFDWLNMTYQMTQHGVEVLTMEESIITLYPFNVYLTVPDFGFDITLYYDTIMNISSNAYKINSKRMHDILKLYEVPAEKRQTIVDDIFEFLKETLNVTKKFDQKHLKWQCHLIEDDLEYSAVYAVKKQFAPYYRDPCIYFYHRFNKIIEKRQAAVANYLALKFLYHMDAQLKDADSQKDFCIQHVLQTMIYFFDHLYMKIFFSTDIKNDVHNMIQEMRKSLHTLLLQADWMDATTLKSALQKASLLGEQLGRYEDPALIKRLLDELKNLEFIEGNFHQNMLNMKKFQYTMAHYSTLHFEELDEETQNLAWLVGIKTEVSTVENNIYITAGVLQPPLYHNSWPDYIKYGALGSILGHEFTHGFTGGGFRLGSMGEFNMWLSSASNISYRNRTQCFVKHYEKYVVPEIHRRVNGTLTLDENIADIEGLRMAYMAYRQQNQSSDTKSGLPASSLEFSSEQLFFLAASQNFCKSFNEADYWEFVTDLNVVNKYRVLGMLSNNEDFARAYNCPLGSKMNPTKEKCRIF